jgi:hypothetical protein
MATKKAKRKTTKQPKRITGLEASLLSFRARNGATSLPEFAELEKYVSAHVRRIVFAGKKSKAGRKTLDRMRKVAEKNTRRFGVSSDPAITPDR